MLLLGLVLLAALAFTRTCGSREGQVSKDEAIAIAKDHAAFTPCTEQSCIVIRAVQRGIPTRLVWIVGLAESLDENGRPVRFQNFLVDAETGEITPA